MAFMQIHQISANYEALQDRILLRISTREGEREDKREDKRESGQINLWFTQRMMQAIWPQLQAYDQELALRSTTAANPDKVLAHSTEARQMLAELKREEVLGKADFSQPFVPAPEALAQETLLVTELSSQLLAQANFADASMPQIELHFEEVQGEQTARRGLRFQLTPMVYHGMVAVLQRALIHTQWGFSQSTPHLADVASSSGHDTDSPPVHMLH